MDRSAIILVIPIAEKHQWTFLNKLNPSWVLTAAKKNVSAVTKHCPRDPWFPNYPASISLWECQNYVLSPIYSFHLNELALMLTKSDSNISKQNACCLCNSPMSNKCRIGANELMLATLQQRFPPRDRVSVSCVRLRQSLTPALRGHI